MPREKLTCLSAFYIAACAPCFAADLPMRSAPPALGTPGWGAGSGGQHPGGGGLAWGLAPGVGQLGAAGFGYYRAESCWSYELVYDRFGNYVGEQPANVCLPVPRN
jgi:hypothetical protein